MVMMMLLLPLSLFLVMLLALVRKLSHQPAKLLVLFISMEIWALFNIMNKLSVSMVGRQFTELNIIVRLASFEIPESSIGFRNSNKLLFSFRIFRSVSGMQLQSLPSVGSIHFLETSISSNSENLIEVLLTVGIVLLKELLFVLFDAIVLEEPLESLKSIILGVVVAGQLVVVIAARLVGQDGEGMGDVIEHLLSVDAVSWVTVGMPFSCEFPIGDLDFGLGGMPINSEQVVEVLIMSICVGRTLALSG